MSDLSFVRTPFPAAARRLPKACLLYVAVGAAGVGGVVLGRLAGGAPSGIEWQLAVLLRFMAIVKAAAALGALGLAQWRLRRPVSDGLAIAYGLALAAMAAAPGLIWSLAEIVPGAVCFHVGLLLFLLLAWRDDGVALSRRRS